MAACDLWNTQENSNMQESRLQEIYCTEEIPQQWASDYCLIPNQQFFRYIMEKTIYISIRWWWCTRPMCGVDFYSVSSL